MPKKLPEYERVIPNPDNFIQSARSFGYSIETAIADLIDNSIAAGASEIDINYHIDRYSSYLRIEDNGKGMNEKELHNAMRIGSFNPLTQRRNSDLGRFGLGLKTASFSQCRRLTVKTRNKTGKTFIRCWDLDTVHREKDWILIKGCIDKKSEKNIGNFRSKGSGTIILWEKPDRLIESEDTRTDKDHFYRKFNKVKRHLGLTFHMFIEAGELLIRINGEEIQAFNPFHISEKIPSTELQEEHLSINGNSIKIQPFILPHESKLTHKELESLQMVRGWTEHQGIYLYRNRRLIADGTWLDLAVKKKENQRLCRIYIEIPNTLDKEWHIDVKKASAQIPDVIRQRIMNICQAALDKAIKVYTQRGAYVRRKQNSDKLIYIWMARSKHGKKFYEINKEHPIFQMLYAHLREKAGILEKYVKLIGESIPLNQIINDFSDHNTLVKDYFEDSLEELRSIQESVLAELVQSGFSESEATEKISEIDCFQILNGRKK